MPTSLETITTHNRDDVFATIELDTETGTLAWRLSGPESSIGCEIDQDAVENVVQAIDELDSRLKAWSDAIDALRLAIMRGDVLDHFTAPEA